MGICVLAGFLIMLVETVGKEENPEGGNIFIFNLWSLAIQNSTVVVIVIVLVGIPTSILFLGITALCCFHFGLVSRYVYWSSLSDP